jgi:CRISPR-associated exonuclease Cas4
MDFQFITPSEVMEYLFCPRFVYYMNVLKISQHEHRRNLVNKGRDIHQLKLVQNKEYLRKSVGAVDKLVDVYLSSESLRLVGRMDEVLFLNDGSAAPLDYKYAYWENKVYKTLKFQQVLYSMLIMENFNVPVDKAFIVYTRTKNHLVEIPINQNLIAKAKQILDEVFKIINLAQYPKATTTKRKCEDCTYRNICVA